MLVPLSYELRQFRQLRDRAEKDKEWEHTGRGAKEAW